MSTDSNRGGAGNRKTGKERGGGETGTHTGATGGAAEPLLRVKDLVKYYPTERKGFLGGRRGEIKAVDGVSFDLQRGETLGLVGETGCGKSTIARTLMRLEEPTSGAAYYKGRDLFTLSKASVQALRREIQMVFQDPFASLNPRMEVGQIIAEPWVVHPGIVPKEEQRGRVGALLERVGLPAADAKRYPHEFSGGQRQRIGIARALALQPDLIICDEPVSALDVSVQAQVINLLVELQAELGLSYIFIAHDLAVVRQISDRVAVMHLGRIVEVGGEDEIYARPTHPYTQALLSAAPAPNPVGRKERKRIVLEGELPSPVNPPSGCTFRTRCWKAESICSEDRPQLIDRFDHGHPSACHFAELQTLPAAGTA
ncbi:MAG: dipeptide ABC transporter ATP-binding protein [Caldilineaceae bacterium]|nr:dipeptide ABC transporter ATP-binding protein [Caldilineaceae bacterium]